MPKEATNWVKRLKGKVKEHSPAGKLYKELGDKGTEQVYAERQRKQRLSKRISDLGKTKETAAQKEQGTYVSSSGPSDFKSWQKSHGGKSPQSDVREYGRYEKSFGGVK